MYDLFAWNWLISKFNILEYEAKEDIRVSIFLVSYK